MRDKILEILGELRPEFDFSESSDFIEDGYLDSFDVVTLVANIEEEYNIVIDGTDVIPENFSSVERICAFIEELQRKEADFN